MGFDNRQVQIRCIYLFSTLSNKYQLCARCSSMELGCIGGKSIPCLQGAYILVRETDKQTSKLINRAVMMVLQGNRQAHIRESGEGLGEVSVTI